MKLLISVTVFLLNQFADAIQVPTAWGEPIKFEQQPVILKSQIVGLNSETPVGSFNLPQQQNPWVPIVPSNGNNQPFFSLSSSNSPYATSYNQQLQSLNIQPEQIEALQRKYLGNNNEKYKNFEKAKKVIKPTKIKPFNAYITPQQTKEIKIVPLDVNVVRNEYLPQTRANIEQVLTKNYRDDRTHEPDALDPYLEAISLAKGGKEYRDDKTHEPKYNKDTERLDYTKEKTAKEEVNDEEEETREEPRSEFEVGREVPTRPIYPGPGQWAKPGIKHRPYIHTPLVPAVREEVATEDEERPDGYDIFEHLQTYFNKQKNDFKDGLQQTSQAAKQANANVVRKQDIPWLNNGFTDSFTSFVPSVPVPSAKPPAQPSSPVIFNPFEKSQGEGSPQLSLSGAFPQTLPLLPPAQIQNRIGHHPTIKTSQQIFPKTRQETPLSGEEGEDKDEVGEDDEEEQEFVPTRLYTQVRKTEDEEHLPPDPHDTRLKEVIKDSKIQTVYSEEGFEDSGYDHEGEEKHAEHDEGEVGDEKEELVKKPILKGTSEKEFYSEDSESEGSQAIPTKATVNHLEEPTELKQRNFIKTKETKTMAVKNKGDGKMEMEISSEVKTILQPNNSTKTHKYVKIFPKITKDLDEPEDAKEGAVKKNEVNNSTITVEENPTNVNISDSKANSKTKKLNLKSDRNNNTNKKVISKAKELENEPLEKVSLNSSRLGKKRNKRYTNDFPKVEIDTEFIDKINHTLLPYVKKVDKTAEKYPNYHRKDINEDSPLRYAERMENIPVKVEGQLSFYQKADTKHGCSDIPEDVNPIPKRVKQGREGVEKPKDESDATPKTPRLKNLGDKIDCLKVRYFGENPLDNPFFKEELVGPVKPLFAGLGDVQKQSSNIKDVVSALPNTKMPDSVVEESQINNETIESNEIFNKFKENKTDIIESNKNKFPNKIETHNITEKRLKGKESTQNNDEILAANILADINEHIINRNKSLQQQNVTTSVPVVYFLTTPKYTIDLKPKHIYDQIELLDHLPSRGNNHADRSDIADDIYYMEDVIEKTEIDHKRQAKVLVDPVQEMLPQNEALMRRKFRQRTPLHSKYYNMNRFLPPTTTSVPIINTKPTTVLPKYKVVSEVFYKDDIKPNEQLNVFTDVLNIIKNSPTEAPTPQNFNWQLLPDFPISQIKKTRVKKYQEDSSYNANLFNTPSPKVTQTTEQYFQSNIPHIFAEHNPTNFNNKATPVRKGHRKKKPTTLSNVPKSTTLRSPTGSLKKLLPVPEDIIDDSTPIIGLVPPGNWEYKTIVEPPSELLKPVTEQSDQEQESQEKDETIVLNTYLVPGMRPPPVAEPFVYSDFLVKDNNALRKRNSVPGHTRVRRSPSRPSYSEFSRNRGKQNEELETTTEKADDDDYIPHRPKNYYYDENTGQIVYLKKPEDTTTEAEEELEYVEVVEETPRPKKEKVTTKPLLATATPPPAGQGFIDFVVKLKNNENYKFIPDPTTTERGQVAATSQQVVNVVKAEATAPPEFLNILAKVKNDDSYKEIKDPEDEKKNKKKTTLPQATRQEIEEEETQETQENVQNSPGGQVASSDESRSKFQIFDISGFLPKIKHYSPKTAIDYSKYKTIERPSTRHNLSSRYNLDDTENLEEVVTVRRPAILEKDEAPAEDEDNVPTLVSMTPTEALPTKTTNRRRRPVPLRNNRRTITTEASQTEGSEPTEEQIQPHHDKAKRVYRRRPTRIRSTTTKFMDEYEGDMTKILRKRSDPISDEEEAKNSNNDEDVIEENLDEPTENSKIVNTESPPKQVANNSKKPADVVIINKDYDKTKKHGGNYKKEPISEAAIQTENIKQAPVIVFRKHDKNRKHGGNYKKDEERAELDKLEAEEETERKVLEQPEESQQDAPRTNPNVVIIKDYDKTKKHGGNYRVATETAETDDLISDAESSESIAGLQPNKEQTNSPRNKNFKTNQNSLERKREINLGRRNNQYHNQSRDIQDRIKQNENADQLRRKVRVKPNNRNTVRSGNVIPLQRLSDVVPKPEGFYTDPKLPGQINLLKESKISSEEVEDIVESVEKSKQIENESKQVKNTQTTKKPLFIKDPGKRLYFYAPV